VLATSGVVYYRRTVSRLQLGILLSSRAAMTTSVTFRAGAHVDVRFASCGRYRPPNFTASENFSRL
jgi:hypothetical protein